MKITKTGFKDLLIIEHDVHLDNRGLFKEVFRKDVLEDNLGYAITDYKEDAKDMSEDNPYFYVVDNNESIDLDNESDFITCLSTIKDSKNINFNDLLSNFGIIV